jgi:hypothetical protein
MIVRWDVGVWRATLDRSTRLKVLGFLLGEGLFGTLTTIANAWWGPTDGEDTDRALGALAAFGIGVGVFAVLWLLFTLVRMPYRQRNQLRNAYAELKNAATSPAMDLRVEVGTLRYAEAFSPGTGYPTVAVAILWVSITNRGSRRVNLDPSLDFDSEEDRGVYVSLDPRGFARSRRAIEAIGDPFPMGDWLDHPLAIDPDSTAEGLLAFIDPFARKEFLDQKKTDLWLHDFVTDSIESHSVRPLRFA